MTETREWATTPLLDPANVGKWVHYAWNSNRSYPAQITRVTRRSVFLDFGGRSGGPYIPEEDGYASRKSGGYSMSIETNAAMTKRLARHDLEARVRAATDRFSIGKLTDAQLEGILAAIGRPA